MLGNISHHVTFRCNLKCGMCLFHVLSQDDELVSQELSTEAFLEHIDTLPECKMLTLSGGEPFLREDLDQLVLAAIEKTNHLYLNTNGILTRKLEDLLLKLGNAELLPKITVIISLDGASPKTHDKIRGVKGAWVATTKSLQLLHDLDVARGATMVVQPDNYLEIYDLYQLGRTWDLNAGFQMVMPGADYSTSQLKDIYRQLKIVWEDINDLGYEYYLRGSLYHQIYEKRPVPCYLGTTDIGSSLIRSPLIDPIGNVYPCGNSPWIKQMGYGCPNLIMGNVRDTPLIDIIQSNRTREVLDLLDTENCDWCWSNCSIEPTFSHLKTLTEEELINIDRLNNPH